MNKLIFTLFTLAVAFIPIQSLRANDLPQSLAPLVSQLKDKVVVITAISPINKDGEQSVATGSGYITDSKTDLIVTNNHVVSGSVSIKVELNDGSKYSAKIIGTDPKSDIALLKLVSESPLTLPQIEFANSDLVRVGDRAIAIGTPFGLKETVTFGIVSALHRDINVGPYDDLIQTDASINKGNSGGPLFNMQGEVIGMNSEIISPSGTSAGIGFAIPSNEIVDITDQLLKKGHVTRGYIGIVVQNLTDDVVSALKLKDDNGALVVGIIPSGPASHTVIQTADVILSVDGHQITSVNSLPKIVAVLPVGKSVNIVVSRHGDIINVPITIAELPGDKSEAILSPDSDAQPGFDGPEQKLGLVIDNMKIVTASIALCKKYGHIKGSCHGSLVVNVIDHSSADVRGVKVGDVIVGINQNPINDADDVIKFYKLYKITADTLMFLELEAQDGTTKFVVVK